MLLSPRTFLIAAYSCLPQALPGSLESNWLPPPTPLPPHSCLKGKGTVSSENEIAKITKLTGVDNFSQKLTVTTNRNLPSLSFVPLGAGENNSPLRRTFTFWARSHTNNIAILEYFASPTLVSLSPSSVHTNAYLFVSSFCSGCKNKYLFA